MCPINLYTINRISNSIRSKRRILSAPMPKPCPRRSNRIMRHHPRLHNRAPDALRLEPFQLSDAQLVIAREHGFESWPKFAQQIETIRLTRAAASLDDPAFAFMEAACVPRHGHSSGTLEEADMILRRYRHVATSSIYTAALLADETSVRVFLAIPLAPRRKADPAVGTR